VVMMSSVPLADSGAVVHPLQGSSRRAGPCSPRPSRPSSSESRHARTEATGHSLGADVECPSSAGSPQDLLLFLTMRLCYARACRTIHAFTQFLNRYLGFQDVRRARPRSSYRL
jgi:hypothetical protein